MIPALTERQRYWLGHIQTCKDSGKTITVYAAEHGFTPRAMFLGKKTLVKKGVLPGVHRARFQRVQVLEAAQYQMNDAASERSAGSLSVPGYCRLSQGY